LTALCSGGASGPKPGVADTIIFTAGSLSSLLNNKGGFWATLAAPLLGVLAYEATSLCSTDPPAEPTITTDEYKALLALSPWDDLQSALVKLKDIVTRIVWYDMCECTSVATPGLPVDTLDPPANIYIPNYNGDASCPRLRARVIAQLLPANPVPNTVNITRQLFPGVPVFQSKADANFASQDMVEFPVNWSVFDLAASIVSGDGTTGSHSYTVTMYGLQYDGSFANNIFHVSPTMAAPYATAQAFRSSGTWQYLVVHASWSSPTTADGILDVSLDMGCSDQTSGSGGCCTDPNTLSLLGSILTQVNLIQRQQVPFAYVTGTPSTGLTGTGELALQGVIGALVELTAISTIVGEESGTPTQTFEAGWVSWGNADGFTQREWLSNETLVSLPAAAGQFTRLGYTLAVGVTATITPLLREP